MRIAMVVVVHAVVVLSVTLSLLLFLSFFKGRFGGRSSKWNTSTTLGHFYSKHRILQNGNTLRRGSHHIRPYVPLICVIKCYLWLQFLSLGATSGSVIDLCR